MTHKLDEQDISRFYRDGYIVFRRIIPSSLIRDLRREADKAHAIAIETGGPNAQRLQPIGKYSDRLEMQPFTDYAQLPDLNGALHQLLTPRHTYGNIVDLGILFNPTTNAWCTGWHRDITLKSSRLPAQEFQDLMLDWNCVNQINAPLYDDDCTWFVPGSHLRIVDMPGETAAAHDHWNRVEVVTEPIDREIAAWNYTVGMPGEVQLRLNAGDFALYRPVGWHTGNYVPYRKRATLHDGVMTPEYYAWWKQWIGGGSPRYSRQLNHASAQEAVAV